MPEQPEDLIYLGATIFDFLLREAQDGARTVLYIH